VLVNELRDLLTPYRGGSCPIFVEYRGRGAESKLQLGEEWRVSPAEELVRRLRERMGGERVRVLYS
jgi:DNA polymerase-3 subunit alpha